MGALLVVPPAGEPITIAEAKQRLRVTDASLDPTLGGYIIATRAYVEFDLRRALLTQTWDFTYDYDWPKVGGFGRIDVPLQPVQSITSITYVDSGGATQTLAADQYQVVGAAPDSLCKIVPSFDVGTFPAVRRQAEAITVRAVVGYGTARDVPVTIKQAMLLQLELLYDREPTMRETLELGRDALLSYYRVIRL